MTDERPTPKYRKDYRRPDFQIEETHLHFDLGEEETVVRSRLHMHRREGAADDAPLILDGEELQTRAVKVDGKLLAESDYRLEATSLTIPDLPASFTLETEVVIRPQENASLNGLYKSSGVFCTQCEAEGFRRITWFLDRPDVMSRYTTTIVADKERYPILLSNGNRIASGDVGDGRHEVSWRDPFNKPSYLFAMVAGRLECHRGEFTTRSDRKIDLEIWVEPQNIDRCEHALKSLQQAMTWDEERFGLEYDLDTYMIVAVNDFNMGAMENKSLNIFNSKFVLASPEIRRRTDDYLGTSRRSLPTSTSTTGPATASPASDWFQLSLKEGLTVFRDQEFSV